MYLHVGNGETVRRNRIVGIFDLDTATVSAQTRAFLARAEKDGVTVAASDGDLPKSFIVLAPRPRPVPYHRRRKEAGERRDSVRLLRISSTSLRARAEAPSSWTEEE